MTGCAQWCPVRIAMPSRSSTVPMSCGWMPSRTNESTLAFRLPRRHLLEERALAVEDADARRPVHLVPAERVEVAVERLDVDREVRHGLRAVDERHGTRAVCERDHLPDGVDGAERVRHV